MVLPPYLNRCCIADTLVRSGAQVTIASVEPGSLTVTCSRGIKIVADKAIEDCEGTEWDMVVCPGGMPGAERLRDSDALTRILTTQRNSGSWLGAVCAAPAVVLQYHGLLNEHATCYPAPKFTDALGPKLVSPPCVTLCALILCFTQRSTYLRSVIY